MYINRLHKFIKLGPETGISFTDDNRTPLEKLMDVLCEDDYSIIAIAVPPGEGSQYLKMWSGSRETGYVFQWTKGTRATFYVDYEAKWAKLRGIEVDISLDEIIANPKSLERFKV